MKKYITAALILLTITMSYAQNSRADTSTLLSVHNTGARFKLIPADFGTTVTQDLIGVMVRSYDTVMVLKENGVADTSGRKPIRYVTERRCGVMSQNIKGKVVVMELNKDCDVTQTCLNVQRAGAKAFVIIHNANSQGNIKLPQKGLYKDSIRIPIFTVGSNVGDSITLLLPTVVGIKMPTTPPIQAFRTPNSPVTLAAEQAKRDSIYKAEKEKYDALHPPFSGKGWAVSPNPASDEVVIQYNFEREATVNIAIFNESGQVLKSYELPKVQTGKLVIDVTDWQTGLYNVSLRSGSLKQVKRLVVAR